MLPSKQDTPVNTPITDTDYWEPYTPATVQESIGTRKKDYELNDAILAQADFEVPKSGYDTVKFYILPTYEDGQPASDGLTADQTGPHVDGTQGGEGTTPRANGYTLGYLTGDGIPPNGLPVIPGTQFPPTARAGEYCLRLDYFPNRLFRYDGKRWVHIEDNVRCNFSNSPVNNTLRSSFVNNTYTTATTDQGNIPSRQSLSEVLRPRADNGSQGGHFPAKPYPNTQPGQKSS